MGNVPSNCLLSVCASVCLSESLHKLKRTEVGVTKLSSPGYSKIKIAGLERAWVEIFGHLTKLIIHLKTIKTRSLKRTLRRPGPACWRLVGSFSNNDLMSAATSRKWR